MDCRKQLQPQAMNQISPCQINSQASDMIHERRSANYKPNIWKHDYLQSLTSIYDAQEYEKRAQKLKEDVKGIFKEAVDLVAKLELIDSLNKLGIASHFEVEIKEALDSIASTKKKNPSPEEDLYTTALRFRLLRQHGYEVSQDMFRGFMDEKTGLFKKSTHVNIKEMLELLEISHLALEGENMLDEARDFSTATLKETISNLDSDLAEQVAHALELPSHRRVQWFDVKWYIKACEKDRHMNAIILELAKIHFNIVQATLQKELRESSRWWRNLGLMENLSFARDRLAESFMCAMGVAFEPKYAFLRKWLTKVINLILIIDDVYDVYGTLEELKHFTNAVYRWDVNATQQLPECMKICFLALYNTTNEIANEMQKETGGNQLLPHLKEVWTDFCNALFLEAKWYSMGYTPSLQEYLSNAWISSTAPILLVHEFFSMGHEVTKGMEDFLEKNQEIVYNISLIIRLCNDLMTSMAERERGDAPSSIVCYMREANVSEEIAQKHIKGMINKTWKKINGQCFNQSPMLQSFVNIATNNARVAHSLYQYGDGFGVQDRHTRKNIMSLLVEPLLLD
ncbi:(E,E)-alpha-farnesene synthase-like isoform X1 [Fagus crenata]